MRNCRVCMNPKDCDCLCSTCTAARMSNYTAKYYSGPDDCDWLLETTLREFKGIPKFNSFVLRGNEDCPLIIELYEALEPLIDDEPIGLFVRVLGELERR